MDKLACRKRLLFSFIIYFMLLATILLRVPAAKVQAISTPVLINEVMYDPEGTDAGYEWIEIKNISGYYINLRDWKIQAAGTQFTDIITLENFKMAPGEIRLIGEPLTTADYKVTSLSFQNGGSETDGIRILNNEGFIRDAVFYDYPNTNLLTDENGVITNKFAPDVTSGNSLCRISANDTDNSEYDFIECPNPTPGKENTFSPTAVIDYDEPFFIGKETQFDGSQSSDYDGNIINYEWIIDDNKLSSNDQLIKHTFLSIDNHSIELTVTDNDGLINSTSIEVSVIEDPENPILTSIENAIQSEDGVQLNIKGCITASPGTVLTSEGYIQDNTSGIRFKFNNEPIKTGKTYILKGKIDTVYGEKRLVVSNIIKTEDQITIKSILISDYDQVIDNLARLVEISGTVVKKSGNNIYLDLGGKQIAINIPKLIDYEIPSDIKGKNISVTGIVSQYGKDEEGNPKVRIMALLSPIIESDKGSVLAVTGQSLLSFLVIPIVLIFMYKYLIKPLF